MSKVDNEEMSAPNAGKFESYQRHKLMVLFCYSEISDTSSTGAVTCNYVNYVTMVSSSLKD